MKKVQILLSSYNGEKFIKKQIDSILQQDFKELSILIRDDGSSDRTIDIIKEYSLLHKNIKFYTGKNIGAQNSFFNLLENADQTCDYYALADQDDIWKNNKVSKAIDELDKYDNNFPVLYSSDVTLVNEQLKIIKNKIRNYHVSPSFGNALVENICIGCTLVLNKKLLDLITNNIPHFSYMHDWWIYIVASYFGTIIFDYNSYVFYRQHSNNAIGTYTNFYSKIYKRVKNVKKIEDLFCNRQMNL
ncbi:glycosyltransferase [Anaerocolumna sedimenticola]|uniref:Glycosyltransferase n=1 Tax=Anaerocolumna sedimenticola TaxID=2696063 RepID=A0A6P1TN00_9FIRM|nr:glycosyltransferase family 2 protein [Anaerocolumna sedimenticola]QHQ61055.1 glycosyltransferase [Anaerocolumna sedimenticola]